jgi:hypothetical protein
MEKKTDEYIEEKNEELWKEYAKTATPLKGQTYESWTLKKHKPKG